RLEARLSPRVASAASLFVSRWDVAANPQLPPELRNRLGLAIAWQTYAAYISLMDSTRWRRLAAEGARPQRLLFASTGTKDPAASDILYVTGLIAPDTINTMPVKTLAAFADHGVIGDTIPADGGQAERVLSDLHRHGVN